MLRTVPVAALGLAGLVGSGRATTTRTARERASDDGTTAADAFEQVAKVAATEPDGRSFATEVGISDDGVAVAGNGGDRERANTFARDGNEWAHESILRATDGDDGDDFGETVALSGDGNVALVGARFDDDPNGGGAAYVFERAGDEWTQATKLVADDGDDDDGFGTAVSLSGDGTTALVGAGGDEDPNGRLSGSAYVFERAGGEWTQASKLAPAGGDNGDRFGRATSLSGDGTTAVVGAPEDEVDDVEFRGSAYVFERSDDGWTEAAKLTASDGESFDYFGHSVSLSADGAVLAVGATEVSPGMSTRGKAYVFERSGGTWSDGTRLTGEGRDNPDEFGSAVATFPGGNRVLVGAPDADVGDSFGAGRVHAFGPDGEGWSQVTTITPDDGDDNDRFGSSLSAAQDGTVLVGAHHDDDPNGVFAGSAYVFTGDPGGAGGSCVRDDASVDTEELRNAIRRWAAGEIDTDCLRAFIRAWARSG